MSGAGRLPRLTAVSVPVLVLAACGGPIDRGELEAQVAGALESRSGVAAEVSCLGDLAAEVDAHTECTATDPATGEERTWRIVVTSVEDGTAQFDIERVD